MPAEDRTLTLSFSATHHEDVKFQDLETEEGFIKTQMILSDGSGSRIQFASYRITLKEAGGTQPILQDAFHAPDGNLTLVLIPDEGTIRVVGAREPYLNAWVPDGNGSIQLLGSEISHEGEYELFIEVLGVDNIRNLLPPDQWPAITIGWGREDTSDEVSFKMPEMQPEGPPVLEPIVGLKTDRAHYEPGDIVVITGNVGQETARFVREGNGAISIRINQLEPPSSFVLMDDIANVTEWGDLAYSFPMKGLGTSTSGIFGVQVSSPGGQASTTYNYTYSLEKAVSSNPSTVDWGDQPLLHPVDVFDMRYGEDPTDAASQKIEHSFTKEIRYKIIPEGSATLSNMTAQHLKAGSEFVLGAQLNVELDAQGNGTLILDIPIDVVEPDQLKLRGLEARMLDGAAPFDISSGTGTPRSKLLYYNEVQHVIAIDFTAGHESFSILGKTAEPIANPDLLAAYSVPEFGHAAVLAAVVFALLVAGSRLFRQRITRF